MPLLAAFTLYLLTPFAHQRIKQFQHDESRFGTTYFSFDAGVGAFYKAYLTFIAIMLAGAAAISLAFGGVLAALLTSGAAVLGDSSTLSTLVYFVLAIYAWGLLAFPIFLTMIQNLRWSNTTLDGHHFKSEMKWSRTMFIAVTNIIGIVLTLGLFIPFAKIRALKYRIQSMTLLPIDNLENFIADTQANVSSTGEGMADLLDFDLSL